MSAHPASHRGGWLSALVAQVSDWVFEEVEEPVEEPAVELKPRPVVAVVAAAPRAGASTIARLLAAELAGRDDGAAVVVASAAAGRSAPPSRAAIRVSTALTGVGRVHSVGRLCVVATDARATDARATDARATDAPATDVLERADTPAGRRAAIERIGAAARYLAPVVLDVSADGSAAGIARVVDRVVVVAPASAEPALLDAVANVIGGDPLKVVNRIAEPGEWRDRADLLMPESRIGVRAAVLGTRAVASLGTGIAELADALEVSR
jgi:hypothetical protein